MGAYQPIDYVCDDGDLTISGVPMRNPAWAVLDLSDLWLPADVRGQSRIVPGAAGVITNPKRKTITRHSLALVVTGGFDQFGNENPDPFEGLKANVDYLRANVFDPPVLPLVTRAAVLTEPDGTTMTAQVQLLGWTKVRKVAAVVSYMFTMEIPAGEFT